MRKIEIETADDKISQVIDAIVCAIAADQEGDVKISVCPVEID